MVRWKHHTRRTQKLNIWASIVGKHVIGPTFIRENLNGEVYHDLLQNVTQEDENLIGRWFSNRMRPLRIIMYEYESTYIRYIQDVGSVGRSPFSDQLSLLSPKIIQESPTIYKI